MNKFITLIALIFWMIATVFLFVTFFGIAAMAIFKKYDPWFSIGERLTEELYARK